MPGVETRKILAVVVRYNTPFEESQTLVGIGAALAANPDLAKQYHLFVWDNSPQALPEPPLPIPYTTHHATVNLGVSGAYNSALAHALEQGGTWMLLLDQDTTITAEFLRRMLAHSVALETREEIAAIAPTVRTRGVVISPLRQLFNRNRPYAAGAPTVAQGEATAANSGCLVRVSALAGIGGYDTNFWLDYSDMYVFHRFFLAGKKVWLATDVELEHELSIMDYDRLMTPWRYRNFSYAETAYNDLFKGRIEGLVQSARVFVRALKQKRKYRNPEFSRIAWEQFFYRLRVRRSKRIARWNAQGAKRRGSSPRAFGVEDARAEIAE